MTTVRSVSKTGPTKPIKQEKWFLKQMVRLGRQIRRVRRHQGLTQEALAARVGVSVNWIGRIEIGQKVPNVKLLSKIARACAVKVSDLFPF